MSLNQTLADVATARGDGHAALEYLTLALEHVQGDRWDEAWLIYCQASAYDELGEYDNALDACTQAEEVMHEYQDMLGLASCHLLRGVVQWNRKESRIALASFKAALPLYEALRDGAYNYAFEGYVRCLARLGKWDDVQQEIQDVPSRLARLGVEFDMHIFDLEAVIAARCGDWDGVDCALDALERIEQPEYLYSQCLDLLENLSTIVSLRQDDSRLERIDTLRHELQAILISSGEHS